MLTIQPRAYTRLLAAIQAEPWLIDESALHEIIAIIERGQAGERLTAAEVDEVLAAKSANSKPRQEAVAPKGIALIRVHGTLVQRASHLRISEQGLPVENLIRDFKAAQNDPAVGAIVLDFDTPGGSVYGIPEAADTIYGYGGGNRKPVWSIANPRELSAGFYLGSQADRMIASEESDVGSVAVISVHVDQSEVAKAKGERFTIVRSSGDVNKDEFTSLEPLRPEAAAHLQSRVDAVRDAMWVRIARGRGVSQKHIRENFGRGRYFGAAEALDRKMIDRIDTLQGTLDRLAAKLGRGATVSVRRPEAQPDDDEKLAAGVEAAATGTETIEKATIDANTSAGETATETELSATLSATETTEEETTAMNPSEDKTKSADQAAASTKDVKAEAGGAANVKDEAKAAAAAPTAPATSAAAAGGSGADSAVASLAAQVEQLTAALKTMQEATAKAATDHLETNVKAKLDQLCNEGRITPADAESELPMLLAVSAELRDKRFATLSRKMALPPSVRQAAVAAELAAAGGEAGKLPKLPAFLPPELLTKTGELGAFTVSAIEVAGGEDEVKKAPLRLLAAARMMDPTGANLFAARR
jgi:ClpP class serine protease